MRTEKFTQVEALVAKYKNLAKKEEPVIAEKKKLREAQSFPNYSGDLNVIDLEHQILGYFYTLVSKDSADKTAAEYWAKFAKYYNKGLLSAAEEDFLTCNFEVLVEYLFKNSSSWEISSIPLDAPSGWSQLVAHLLFKKESANIFLPSTYLGLELIGLRNCTVTICNGIEYAALLSLSTGHKFQKHYWSPYSTDMDGVFAHNPSFDIVIAEPLSCVMDDEELTTSLNKIYALVREGGELLICFNHDDILCSLTKDFREMIIKKQELAKMIELPDGKVLLHIVKSPQSKVLIINASSSIFTTKEKNSLDIERFLELYASSACQDEKKHQLGNHFDYSNIVANLLIPSFYLDNVDGTCLSSFVEEPESLILTKECKGTEKVVTINNLSTTFSRGEVSIEKLKSVDMKRMRRYWSITCPCVFLAVSRESIAVGYKTDQEPVLVPKTLYVLKTKSAEDARFLASLFLSTGIQKKICRLVYASARFFKIVDGWLDYIKIPELDKEKQREFVSNIYHSDWQELEQREKAEVFRNKQSIRLRKHALSQNISSFDSLFRTLEICYSEQGGRLKKTDRISPISDMTVEDAFRNLMKDLTTIRERVDHLCEEQDWGISESIEPQQFVEDFERNHQGTNFRFDHKWDKAFTNRLKNNIVDKRTGEILFFAGESLYSIWFPKAALNQVLENILANALEHGFIDSTRDDYRICFEWKTSGLNLVMSVSNNGEPISQDMSPEKIMHYGYSSVLNKNGHGGIGGGQIADIMREYGGSVEIVSTPYDNQTVTYKLTMPLASLY